MEDGPDPPLSFLGEGDLVESDWGLSFEGEEGLGGTGGVSFFAVGEAEGEGDDDVFFVGVVSLSFEVALASFAGEEPPGEDLGDPLTGEAEECLGGAVLASTPLLPPPPPFLAGLEAPDLPLAGEPAEEEEVDCLGDLPAGEEPFSLSGVLDGGEEDLGGLAPLLAGDIDPFLGEGVEAGEEDDSGVFLCGDPPPPAGPTLAAGVLAPEEVDLGVKGLLGEPDWEVVLEEVVVVVLEVDCSSFFLKNSSTSS